MKPFYIESDEEVTSVIDRLRASSQKHNIFVIPAGATLLQSAVNMRLLLREAQKADKEIAIVTTDEYGQALAQKIGITTYTTLEEVEGVSTEDVADTQSPQTTAIGSASYYENPQHTPPEARDVNLDVRDEESTLPQDIAQQSASIQKAAEDFEQMQQLRGVTTPQHAGGATMDMRAAQPQQPHSGARQGAHTAVPHATAQPLQEHAPQQEAPAQNVPPMDARKQREVQEFFGRRRTAQPAPQQTPAHFTADTREAPDVVSYAHVPDDLRVTKSPMKTVALFSGIGAVVLAAIIGTMIFLPRVTVVLTPTVREQSASLDVTADAAQSATDFSAHKISLIALEKDIEKTMTFDATGTSTAGNYKARGSVTIYNNYSTQPQKLVATTRLLTKDGTLFRLVEGVTVPGMKVIDGKKVPGSVKADVIADKPGEKYNIPPAEFTIPGFKGTARYTKFSATSEAPMIGGGAQGGEQTVVTKEDLEHARTATEEEAMKMAKEQLAADAAAQGKKLLDDALRVEIVSSSTQVVAGVAASSFDYTVHVTARALVFGETDIVLMMKKLLEKDVDTQNASLQDVVLTYGPALADFDKQTLELKVHGTARLVPHIDTAAVAQALAGTKKSDIDKVLSNFAGIEQAELHYNMGFLMGRLPWYTGSIKVVVKE